MKKLPHGSRDATEGARPCRILIVDDHPLMRQGLEQLIQAEASLSVVGAVGMIAEAKLALAANHPDIVLLDLSLQCESGLDLLKEIQTLYPEVRVLVLSMHDETLFAERALRAGARGYVEKHMPGAAIIEAIRAILDGRLGVSPLILARMAAASLHPSGCAGRGGVECLTNRELVVFEATGKGLSTTAIADALCLSVKTVETHIARIKCKLHLPDHNALVRAAAIWYETDH